MGDGSSRDDRTVYIKNLDNKVTEEILFELFLQAGPLVSVKRPKDQDGNSRPFAFVEFEHDVSPPYARSLMDGIKLFGRSIGVQFRSGSRHSQISYGNSPSATPPYHANGSQSPAPNGFPSFPTPPMVQRTMSAPESMQGLMDMGHIMPRVPLIGHFPRPEYFPGGMGPRLGLMPLMLPPGPQFDGLKDGPPLQHLPDHHDNTPHHRDHHRRPSQEHRRSHQSSEEEPSSRSHHRDSGRHGHSGSRHEDHYQGNRGHHSEERRHGSLQRHQTYQHHREDKRDHPYRR